MSNLKENINRTFGIDNYVCLNKIPTIFQNMYLKFFSLNDESNTSIMSRLGSITFF